MKQKFLKTFFLDLSYFIFLLIIFILGKLKLKEILTTIQSFSPSLNSLDPNKDILQAQTLLNQINSLSNQAYLFLFIIIPLLIFIAHVSIQGYSFYILKKEKNYFLKFILINIPLFIFLTLLIVNFNIYLFILIILVGYSTFFLYFKDLSKLKLALTKIYKFFPLFLFFIILFLIPISLFALSYLNLAVNGNYLLFFILGIIFTLILSFYKVILAEKLFN